MADLHCESRGVCFFPIPGTRWAGSAFPSQHVPPLCIQCFPLPTCGPFMRPVLSPPNVCPPTHTSSFGSYFPHPHDGLQNTGGMWGADDAGGSPPPGLESRLCDPGHIGRPLWTLASLSVNGDNEGFGIGGELSEPGTHQPILSLKPFRGQGSEGGAALTVSRVKILSTFERFWNLPWGGVLRISGWSGLQLGSAGVSGDVPQSGASADSTWGLWASTWNPWAAVTVGTWGRAGPPSDGCSPRLLLRRR